MCLWQVRVFTPLTVPLHLGSHLIYLCNVISSVHREGLGFKARVSIEGDVKQQTGGLQHD